MSFGKYKGTSLYDIKLKDTNYLAWILNSDSFEELCVKKESLRLEKEIVKMFIKNK